MKRATITIPDDLESALDAYISDQQVEPALTSIVQTALSEYLSELGYYPGRSHKTLRITPVPADEGPTDVSINHDKYLAEAWLARRG